MDWMIWFLRPREHERTLDKANIGWSERSAAKIVKKADGTTQIYHGGLGKGDGLGHGHVTLAKDGYVTYYRDQWQDKNQGQYLIDESKDDHTKI